MAKLHVAALIAVRAAADFLEMGLGLARVVGLPVDTWRAGDPTRSLYKYLAEALASLDETNAEYIKAAWLSTAEGDWLKVLAWEVYGVEVPEATHATPTVTLTNTGGGFYELDAGDLTVKASAIEKTYHSTSGGTLAPGDTVTFDLVADEAGSGSSVGADEIDELVTTFLGVEIVSSTAAVGTDEPDPETIREQCRATTGALSPNGPPDAYEFVVRESSLTGVTEITRAKATGNSDTGTGDVIVASASGVVSGPSVAAAQAAVNKWAQPLGFAATVISASGLIVNVDADVEGDGIPAGAEDAIESAIGALFSRLPIGGTVARSAIIATIHNTLVAAGATNVIVTLNTPAANVDLASNQVPVAGDVTITEV